MLKEFMLISFSLRRFFVVLTQLLMFDKSSALIKHVPKLLDRVTRQCAWIQMFLISILYRNYVEKNIHSKVKNLRNYGLIYCLNSNDLQRFSREFDLGSRLNSTSRLKLYVFYKAVPDKISSQTERNTKCDNCKYN